MDVAYQGVLDAVRSGRLSSDRINTSVRRVLRLKWERGIVAKPMADPAALAGVIGTTKHLAAAQAITDRSTTLVTNDGTLPIAPKGKKVLVAGYDTATTGQLAAALTARGAQVTTMVTGASPDAATRAAAVAAAAQQDLAVVLTNNMSAATASAANVRSLVAELGAGGTHLVAAALRNPYDVAYGAGVESWLATYSTKPVAIESLARTIVGQSVPQALLPVDVPAAGAGTTAYPFGAGLGGGTAAGGAARRRPLRSRPGRSSSGTRPTAAPACRGARRRRSPARWTCTPDRGPASCARVRGRRRARGAARGRTPNGS